MAGYYPLDTDHRELGAPKSRPNALNQIGELEQLRLKTLRYTPLHTTAYE